MKIKNKKMNSYVYILSICSTDKTRTCKDHSVQGIGWSIGFEPI